MKKIFLTELNRIREIMKLPLLLEGGGLGSVIDTFWDNIISKNINELTTEEKNLLDNLISGSPSIKSTGIKSSLDLVSQSQKDLLLKTMRNNTDEIFKVFTKITTDYISQAKTRLSVNLASIESKLSKEITYELEKLSSLGFDIFTPSQLMSLDNKLKPIRQQFKNDMAVTSLVDDVSDGIRVAISKKQTTKQSIDSLLINKKLGTDELTTNISKNLDSGTDPQAYLNNLSYDELANRLGSRDWKDIGYKTDMMSGWKFHIFGEDIKDAVYLQDALKPVIDKYKAAAKVGGTYHNSAEAFKFKPGQEQYGKQGVTMYIPVDVVNNGKAREMLSDIQKAILGYKKGGTISGDKMITPAIHYRYELMGPIPKDGVSNVSPGINPVTKKPIKSDYSNMYSENEGGPYKPDDIPDLFDNSVSKTVSNVATSSTNRLESIVGDTSLVNWGLIQNAKNAQDYSKLIDDAIKTGNYMGISRQGFEAYGIPDFRKHLINLGLKN